MVPSNKKIPLFFKGKSLSLLLGTYKSNFKGAGLVYKESRPYTSGDPYHRIDRRTSAKKQDLFLKEFEEERQINVLFVVSGGASMQFCSISPTKRDTIQTLGMLLGEIVIQQGDRMSYCLHGAESNTYLPASRSPHQIHFFNHRYENFSWTKTCPPEETAQLLHTYRLRHQLIVWVSDQFVTEQERHVNALAKCNDVLYIHLFDPFEYDADPKHFDKEYIQLASGKNQTISTKRAHTAYEHSFKEHLQASEKLLTSRGITTIHATTTDDPFLLYTKLFEKHALKRQ